MRINPEEVESLARAIREHHGAEPKFEYAVHLVETFEGHTAWSGAVSVFSLKGHPSASKCYAWSSPIERSEKRRYVAVLGEGPIDSPAAAVRAAIAQEARSRKG
jgi:hypothetical protein